MKHQKTFTHQIISSSTIFTLHWYIVFCFNLIFYQLQYSRLSPFLVKKRALIFAALNAITETTINNAHSGHMF